MAKLILIRGLPRSGKSTLAQKFVSLGYRHFEADQWVVDASGAYAFNINLLERAHSFCQEAAREALSNGHDVIVANTFSRAWEIAPYRTMCKRVTIIECQGNFANVHGVPDLTIQRMRERWEAITQYA